VRAVVAIGVEGCSGSMMVTASGRGHGNVAPEGGATDQWTMILV
jgi:hypothetical protein